jgi:pseudouridine 5'-phosphatase
MATQAPDRPICGAVVDLDGTLLDTEPLYYAAYAAVAAHYGRDYSFDAVHRFLLGRAEEEGAATMIRLMGLQDLTPHALLELRDTFLLDEFTRAQPLPGAIAAMRQLRQAGVPLAIATSSCRRYMELKRRNNGELFSLFDAVVCGDDAAVAGKSKPDPAIFLAGASAIGVPPERCIAFEDSVAGVRSARAAGMWTVAVPDARLEAAAVADAAPHVVLRDLTAFDVGTHAGLTAEAATAHPPGAGGAAAVAGQ